ncbi:putative leucine-rich repeat-containing protein DDB_G0290503 [Aplysia californica]|uniref:Leucine-rich repeat-containing protein DDB_G0290503 n=1 Tax=Aplysia californica TaxID=6500 RepID=A0ABM1AC20_APLCA|nr:putative leucine-rich repeat-containing protein DDB_G0290503 [Aplysia californica]
MATSDAEMEMEQLQLQIEQLKSLVRERDEALQSKEKELQDTNSKMSKLRLQAKAKSVKKEKAAQQEAKKETEAVEKTETPEEGATAQEEGSSSGGGQASRAKAVLLKRKLEEKDRLIAEKEEVIKVREGQLESKELVLAERDNRVRELTEQLEEKTVEMEKLQSVAGGGGAGFGDEQGQIQEMYAQMVYKDRRVMELNAKILEQDKRVMDLQEFAGEKDQVIRGRDKVVEVLQISIKEKDQAIQDQGQLITKLTARVESTNEKVDVVTEQLRHKEQELKSETDRFHIKLTESQKYFEEMLHDMDVETKKLRAVIEEKDQELVTRENDLRELISKHERDIETIMKKENIDLQDHVIQMLEGKLRDSNDVLDGKIKVISVLQKESADKERDLLETRETMRLLKEKLQVTSEQMMLLQANFVDMETQWKEERSRLEGRLKDTVEKHETELSEKEVQVATLQSTLQQYETAYNQASAQYGQLQEHYRQALAGNVDSQQAASVLGASGKDQSAEVEALKHELSQSKQTVEKLISQVQELETQQKSSPEEASSGGSGGSSGGGGKSDTKLLKVKAQMTSKIKALEKELQELRQSSQESDEVASLKNQITELEDEKGNLQLKLVDFDEQKAMLGGWRNLVMFFFPQTLFFFTTSRSDFFSLPLLFQSVCLVCFFHVRNDSFCIVVPLFTQMQKKKTC